MTSAFWASGLFFHTMHCSYHRRLNTNISNMQLESMAFSSYKPVHHVRLFVSASVSHTKRPLEFIGR